MVAFFLNNAANLMQYCRTIEELKLAISISGKLLMDCSAFMEQAYSIYEEISAEYAALVAHTEKHQQRVEQQ